MKKLLALFFLVTITLTYALAFPAPAKGSRAPSTSTGTASGNRKHHNPLKILTEVKKDGPVPVRNKGSKRRPGGGQNGTSRGAKQLDFYNDEPIFNDEDPYEAEGGAEYEELDAEETGHGQRYKRSLLGEVLGYPSHHHGHHRRHWWPANHRRRHHHFRHHEYHGY